MEFKEGVYTEVVKIEKGEPVRLAISPEIKAAMLTVNNISKEIAGREIVITAVFDGTHMTGSKHYEGNAFDMRTGWGMYTNVQIANLVNKIKSELGRDYDVVLEKTHLHIEYDPK